MTWLLDTLVWTGALIAFVLLIRRPVARHFGARAAYALWALPLMRLLLPPIVLPASLAPAPEPPVVLEAAVPPAPESVAYVAPVAQPAEAAAIDWAALALAIWLVGVVAFMASRLLAYRRLRRELLADAHEVGVAGKVRLLETSATRSPLAFGVIEKVIALPPGFMAQPDRASRDLALAHELAHHRAHDLAANFAALPLFALHWFNPLSWLGWTAMRRDQEAACDARVIEGRARAERASYAALIAGAVAAPEFALAAPMACPVLGDKSIIHRLRNLTMTDHSLRRRRAGTLLVGAAALVLPLTASFSYAQSSEAEVPAPPAPPAAPPAIEAPLPPEAPAAPAAPDAPEVRARQMVIEVPEGEGKKRRVYVVRSADGEHAELLGDGAGPLLGRSFMIHGQDGELLSPDSPEFKAQMKALEDRMEKLGKEFEGRRFVIDEKRMARMTAEAHSAARAGMLAARMAPMVVENCDGEEGVSEVRGDDGKRVIRICRTKITGHALHGLRAARAAIASNEAMSAETRTRVLEELDREIARIDSER